MQQNQKVYRLIEAAQAMQAVLTGDCLHPHNTILTQTPRNGTAKQECLICRKIRFQKWTGGPWNVWKNR